ncbi:MAG: ATP-binding cassette domain-containing protein [Puniceicoccales bacterium]|jgi:phospholipid/cholesterol/gamma-HCH transport system ATP-binding protein|nr:ATP-binding cassette domain-containing protein [Puniceicoccales bacterium]
MSDTVPAAAPRSTTPHLSARGLALAYGENVILRDVSFDVRRGEVFVIMGGSGCGKSTLLRHLIGLESPAAGEILLNGENFSGAPEERRAALLRRFGVTYQGGALWTSLTLAENVALPLREYTRLSAREIAEVTRYKLALVGLGGFEDYHPSEISGGMVKRAALARAMALDPEILFLDEPSAGLDPVTARLLDELILQLRETLGATVVVVTHELASIFAIADRALFLDAATRTVGALGPPAELRNCSNPRARAFLNRGVPTPP